MGEFRLISYNLLASMYSVTEGALNYFFRHCPAAYLDPAYRFPLIYRELLAYQADVLCLQEVDTDHFCGSLTFLLKQVGGFEGCFLEKLRIDVPSTLKKLAPPQPIASYSRKVGTLFNNSLCLLLEGNYRFILLQNVCFRF